MGDAAMKKIASKTDEASLEKLPSWQKLVDLRGSHAKLMPAGDDLMENQFLKHFFKFLSCMRVLERELLENTTILRDIFGILLPKIILQYFYLICIWCKKQPEMRKISRSYPFSNF